PGAVDAALAEHLDRLELEVAVAPAEGRGQGLGRLALGALLRKLERLGSHLRVGVCEELEQEPVRPRLGDAAHHLAEDLAPDLGVDAAKREAERARAAAADLEAERGLEGLAPDRGG